MLTRQFSGGRFPRPQTDNALAKNEWVQPKFGWVSQTFIVVQMVANFYGRAKILGGLGVNQAHQFWVTSIESNQKQNFTGSPPAQPPGYSSINRGFRGKVKHVRVSVYAAPKEPPKSVDLTVIFAGKNKTLEIGWACAPGSQCACRGHWSQIPP